MKLVPGKPFVSVQDLEHRFDPFRHQPSAAAVAVVKTDAAIVEDSVDVVV